MCGSLREPHKLHSLPVDCKKPPLFLYQNGGVINIKSSDDIGLLVFSSERERVLRAGKTSRICWHRTPRPSPRKDSNSCWNHRPHWDTFNYQNNRLSRNTLDCDQCDLAHCFLVHTYWIWCNWKLRNSIRRSRKPHPRTKHEADRRRRPLAEIWPFEFSQMRVRSSGSRSSIYTSSYTVLIYSSSLR